MLPESTFLTETGKFASFWRLFLGLPSVCVCVLYSVYVCICVCVCVSVHEHLLKGVLISVCTFLCLCIWCSVRVCVCFPFFPPLTAYPSDLPLSICFHLPIPFSHHIPFLLPHSPISLSLHFPLSIPFGIHSSLPQLTSVHSYITWDTSLLHLTSQC